MKNPWKSCHPFYWIQRVYGMQNDRLDLPVNLAEKMAKWCTVARDICTSLTIFLHLFCKYLFLFCNFFQQEWPRDKAGCFACHKPSEFNKMGDNFFMDFLLIDFSKKMFEIVFPKCQMPWGYVELSTRYKKKKTYFGEKHSFLRRMLGLKWDYFRQLTKYEYRIYSCLVTWQNTNIEYICS